MTKKITSSIGQFSEALAVATIMVTVLCELAESHPNSIDTVYLSGMLSLAKEIGIHADMIYEIVIDGCDDMDKAAKIYIIASKAKLAAVTDELELIVDKLIKKESENDEK